MTRKHGALVVLVLVALVGGACQRQGAVEGPGALGAVTIEPGEPIKIAVLQVVSGANTSLGVDQVRGVQIAVDDKGGKLLDRDIQLVTEDELCNAEGGTTAAQKVVADPKIVGIVGTSCSGAAVPASQIMSRAGLTMISGSNTSPRLTSIAGQKADAWQAGYFRTAHNDEIQGAAAAAFAFNELKVTKAASIHDGDPYTQGLATAFNEAFKKLGGQIVKATAVNKGDTDMRPVLTEIAAAGPELIFFPIFQPEGDFIAKQSREIPGLQDKALLMGADGLLSDTYVVIPETKGIYFSGPASPRGGAYDSFVAKYERKFGEKPIQAFHAHAYDAFNMLAAAIEEVADRSGDRITIDRQRLRDAVSGTRDFQGITGSLTCDEFGDCADPKIDVVRNTEQTGGISDVRANVLFTFEP